MTAAYFTALDDNRFAPTEHAQGAWSPDELHVSPVAGLVTHHLLGASQLAPTGTLTRISFDILGKIGRDEITLDSRVIRAGRTIELVESTATIAGRAVLNARAWFLIDTDISGIAGHDLDPLPAADLGSSRLTESWAGGFIASVRGADVDPPARGRGRSWVDTDLPLLAGTEISPVAAFVGLVDTANGIAARQDPQQWAFPNVDLTIHFFRTPNGTPVGMDTRVSFGATGQGLTSTVLYDTAGPVGALQQSLTIRRLPH